MSYVGLLDLSFWLIDIKGWNWLFVWYYPVLIEDITSHSSLECKIVIFIYYTKEIRGTNKVNQQINVWQTELLCGPQVYF